MLVNMIGAGRLGKHLALALIRSTKIKLSGICNSEYSSAVQATKQIKSGLAVPSLADLPPADITFICSGDDQISVIVEQLVSNKLVRANSIVAHCSGALSSSILAPLKTLDCKLASIHPLKSFNNSLTEDAFAGCNCVVEGDNVAQEVLTELFQAMNANIYSIKPESKTVYHAAAVIASNYLVTLAATAKNLFAEAAIPLDLAKSFTTNIMQGTLNNIKNEKEVNDALTGPLLRGDVNTLSNHLNALHNPTVNSLYRAAAHATLPMTKLTAEKQDQLRALFD